ncbi:hypothetical protein D3C81_1166890 [compost metagenome]
MQPAAWRSCHGKHRLSPTHEHPATPCAALRPLPGTAPDSTHHSAAAPEQPAAQEPRAPAVRAGRTPGRPESSHYPRPSRGNAAKSEPRYPAHLPYRRRVTSPLRPLPAVSTATPVRETGFAREAGRAHPHQQTGTHRPQSPLPGQPAKACANAPAPPARHGDIYCRPGSAPAGEQAPPADPAVRAGHPHAAEWRNHPPCHPIFPGSNAEDSVPPGENPAPDHATAIANNGNRTASRARAPTAPLPLRPGKPTHSH